MIIISIETIPLSSACRGCPQVQRVQRALRQQVWGLDPSLEQQPADLRLKSSGEKERDMQVKCEKRENRTENRKQKERLRGRQREAIPDTE